MEFVNQLELAFFNPDEIIVTEGDIIDNLYVIISGKAEVSKHESLDPTKQLILSTLQAGDTIGLSVSGLYSATGIRTATILSLTHIIAIKINVELLNRFLNKYSQLNNSLEAATEQILKLQLIKKAAPFSVLSTEDIKNLVFKIDVIEYPQATIIFKEGDVGDYCYIIQHGQIEISRQEKFDVLDVIATLSTPSIFGETALVMDIPRSATARATSDVKLLRLLRTDLLELLANNPISKQAFAAMILERSRPKCLPEITEHQQVNDEGELTVILKNPITHEYYQLTQEGWLIWQLINGVRPTKDIIMALVMDYHIFSPSMVINLILDLNRAGFIELQGYRLGEDKNLPRWMKIVDKIKKVMEYEWSFPYVDQWLTNIYHNKIKFIYSLPVQLIMLFIALIGFVSFVFFASKALQIIPQTSHIILLIIIVDIAGLISVLLHELAHAFTTKHFNREVSHFGIGWYWIGPMAFTETSDMWLCSKWPRIIVNLAGVWIDFVLAGIFGVIAIIAPWHIISLFCWMFCIYIYLRIYYNLYPLIEYDGYYVLMDLFNRPHLREDAVEWLVDILPKFFKQRVFSKEYQCEIYYWLICILFIILSPCIAWFVQQYILAAIFPVLNQGFWRWLFPMTAITLSLVSVWVEVQKQRRYLK